MAATLGAILGVAILSMFAFSAGADTPEESGESPRVTCPSGDQILVAIPEIVDAPGGSDTPATAVADSFLQEYPELIASPLTVAATSSSHVTFIHLGEGGVALAAVEVDIVGDSWHVTRLQACSSVATTSEAAS